MSKEAKLRITWLVVGTVLGSVIHWNEPTRLSLANKLRTLEGWVR